MKEVYIHTGSSRCTWRF